MEKNSLIEIIKEERIKFHENTSHHAKMEILNNIIQIKRRLLIDFNEELDIYLDIKKFIKEYILSIEEGRYGYDIIRVKRILEYIGFVKNEAKVSLFYFTKRLLIHYGFDDEFKVIETSMKKIEIKLLFENFRFSKLFKLFYLISTYNTITILLVIFLIILVGWIIILPAPEWSNVLFKVEIANYTEELWLNYLLNYIGGLLKINNQYKIMPINPIGVIILAFGRIFVVLFLVNVLLRELNNKLNI
jgi:hypothetical protein